MKIIMASNQILNIVRTYASASTGKLIKPPVQVFGMEGRYASALYSAAVKLKQLDTIEKDLENLKKVIKTDGELRNFIDNPTIKRNLKVDAIKQISTKINLSPPSANFVGLLAENGRLGKIEQVVNAFSTIMSGHRGDLRCEVTTAKPLDEESKKQLQTVLKSFAKKGENIMLELKVDQSLIGGMIVSIGDNYVDMSVASKIKKYTDLITEAV